MKAPFAQLAAGGTVFVAMLMAACSTPHAPPVRCSGPLRPINGAAAAPNTVSGSYPAAPGTPRRGS